MAWLNRKFKAMKELLGGAVMAVILVNLLNAIFALSKDILLAGYLGTTKEADSYFLSFFIPDMIGNNLFAVSAGVAAIPVFAAALTQVGEHGLKTAYKSTMKMVIMIAVGLALTIVVCATPLINLMGSGFAIYDKNTSIQLLICMAPIIIVYPMLTLRMSYLQVMRHPALASISGTIINALILILLIVLSFLQINRSAGIYYLALSMVFIVWVAAYYLKWVMKTPSSNSEEEQGEEQGEENKPYGILFLKAFFPYLTMVFLTQGIFYFERYLGSELAPGSVAAINYANRLSQFPILVFSFSIALVALPEFARLLSTSHSKEGSALYLKAMRTILIMSVPMAIGLSVLREPILTVLFKHNAFDAESVLLSAEVMLGYGLSVIGQGVILLNIRVLIAMGKAFEPILLLVLNLLLNGVLDYLLVQHYGISGIGIGSFAGSTIGAILLTALLLRRLQIKCRDEVGFLLKVILINVPPLLLAFLMKGVWHLLMINRPIEIQLVFGLFSGISICISSYYLAKVFKLMPSR